MSRHIVDVSRAEQVARGRGKKAFELPGQLALSLCEVGHSDAYIVLVSFPLAKQLKGEKIYSGSQLKGKPKQQELGTDHHIHN